MKRAAAVLGVVALVTVGAAAQDTTSRPWQQRLHTEIPLPVPMVPLSSANPFAVAVDAAPRLLSAAAPRRLDVSGRAVAAAYVDAKGECLGAVPLALPFPGLTSTIVEELRSARFDPARRGTAAEPSWTVIEIAIGGRIKESSVADQVLELPDPTDPPAPPVPEWVAPSPNLVNLPATPADQLASPAKPRRLGLKVPRREDDVAVQALVHVTADGRCDRFVPLDVDSGLHRWLSAYLATWRIEPAVRNGGAVDCWVVYGARVRLDLTALRSSGFSVLSDVSYDPNAAVPR